MSNFLKFKKSSKPQVHRNFKIQPAENGREGVCHVGTATVPC